MPLPIPSWQAVQKDFRDGHIFFSPFDPQDLKLPARIQNSARAVGYLISTTGAAGFSLLMAVKNPSLAETAACLAPAIIMFYKAKKEFSDKIDVLARKLEAVWKNEPIGIVKGQLAKRSSSGLGLLLLTSLCLGPEPIFNSANLIIFSYILGTELYDRADAAKALHEMKLKGPTRPDDSDDDANKPNNPEGPKA